ncbi:MAG: hypothetical protein ACKOPD_04835 [Polynucleobacter victoriensis]
MSSILHMNNWGLAGIYIVASTVLPVFYIKQIRKYLNGGNGVGDLCFQTEVIQASLRIPALLYAISIANAPVFISVFLDLVGRVAKLVTAKVVHDKYNLKFKEESEVSSPNTVVRASVN